MNRPVLLVDIDGVLAPWGIDSCPPGFYEYRLFPEDDEPMFLAAVHGQWLRELADHFDLVWGSAWGYMAHRHLAPILELPEFPYVPMPPTPFPPADKLPAIDAYVADRPVAWIDDYEGTEYRHWAERRNAPTLLVEVDHRVGLTRKHV